MRYLRMLSGNRKTQGDIMRTMSYTVWLKYYNLEKELEDCEFCNSGEHDCDCGNMHDCKICDGSGLVDKTYQEFLKIEKRDRENLERYRLKTA